MRLQGFRPLDRGELSIFAAITLVAILGGVGLFLQGVSPTSVSQTAATGSAIEQTCLPGNVNKIYIQRGTFTTVKDKPIDCYAGQSEQQKKSDAPNTQYTTKPNTECVEVAHNQCRVIACVPPANAKPGRDQCSIVGTCNTDDPNDCKQMMSKVQSGKPADVFSVMNTKGGDLPGFTQLLKLDVNGGTDIATAFTKPLSEAQQQLQGQITDYDAAIKQLQGAIDNCSYGNTSESCTSQNLDEWKKQQEQLRKEQADLQSRLKELSDARISLVPQQCPLNFMNPCQAGQTYDNTPGVCMCKGTPILNPGPTCTGQNCGGNSTFGQAQSGMNSLLSGLTRGLGTALRSPIPSQPAAPAQACSTDQNTYAQQQQQYQQQLQQYNYQLQQYQYQQQYGAYNAGGNSTYGAPPPAPPSGCTPSTQQQCSLQPQQPAASTCSSGSWQSIYSGNCIVNWQCSNLGAALSCEPQTADVGMSLAISYSCAQGTATGEGFTASGQSGTTTVTVQQPPQGTNTATYTLTCSSGQVTSGAQCSVQVTSPSIILVANPATISSGGTSLIGWLTTGMQSCVISSPDDLTFTSQNSSNTSVSGTAETFAATTAESYVLRCQTFSGGIKVASTTVAVQ